MKRKFFDKSTHLLIIFFLFSIASCQSQYSGIPYKVGQSYIFRVTVLDSNTNTLLTDTLTMTIKNKGLIGGILGMNMADWKSNKFPENNQKRGINMENEFVELQVPIKYEYLENEHLAIAGYPSYSKSMLRGYSSESEHQFVKGYGKLSGKKLTQYRVVTDSLNLQFQNKMLKCKVSEGKNLSSIEEFGLYKIKTFYNDEHGFIEIRYQYPNKKNIVFQLIEITEIL